MNGRNIYSCLFEIEKLSPPKSPGPTSWKFYRSGLFLCAGPQETFTKIPIILGEFSPHELYFRQQNSRLSPGDQGEGGWGKKRNGEVGRETHCPEMESNPRRRHQLHTFAKIPPFYASPSSKKSFRCFEFFPQGTRIQKQTRETSLEVIGSTWI